MPTLPSGLYPARPVPHHFDIIGDIHGHANELHALLAKLGYSEEHGVYIHPAGRKVVFLGDLIDRGPEIRETLRVVRTMQTRACALVVAGNHEFNALAYATPDGKGGWLRPHTLKNQEQHAATLEQFAGREAEWQDTLAWFRTLPVFLELGGFRAVHAAWDAHSIATLGADDCLSDGFVRRASIRGTPEFRAIEILLKGLEIPLPDGHFFLDNKSHPRHAIRVRWWVPGKGNTFRQLALQPGSEWEIPELPADAHADLVVGYPADEKPVFNGHYWLSGEPMLMAPNVAILDYSVARGGALVAYRWDGERQLDPAKFAFVSSESAGKAGLNR